MRAEPLTLCRWAAGPASRQLQAAIPQLPRNSAHAGEHGLCDSPGLRPEAGRLDETGDDPETAAAEHGVQVKVVKQMEAKRGFVLLPRPAPRPGSRTTRALKGLGLLVAAANMAFAWWILYSARTVSPTLDPAQFATVLNTVVGPAIAERSEIRSLVVTTAIVMNDHAVMLVTVTFAFALVALGFSLFVMGIESTYQFDAEHILAHEDGAYCLDYSADAAGEPRGVNFERAAVLRLPSRSHSSWQTTCGCSPPNNSSKPTPLRGA